MTLFAYKLLAASVILLVSILTAIYLLTKKVNIAYAESFQLGEALASGIFLGAALFHLLPDAIKLFSTSYPTLTYPLPEVICVTGFLLLLFLERCSLLFSNFNQQYMLPFILLIMLTIHALVEGAALGIGPTLAETVMLFIAIVAHKSSESFALAITMLRHAIKPKQVIYAILFFSCMTPLGIFLGIGLNTLTFTHAHLIAGIFDAFAAGTFLYISTLHHIHFHHHHQETQSMMEFGCFTLGLALMAAIAIWT